MPDPPAAPGMGTIDRAGLVAGAWTAWPLAAVRGAGFPAAGLLPLASAEAAAAADGLLDAPPGTDSARAAYLGAFDAGLSATGAAIDAVAADPRFQLALRWQNRGALPVVLRRLAEAAGGPRPRNQARRQYEQLVARYWQRYCAKNDTIGFFGPVGWAEVGGAPRTSAESGPALVRRQSVSFESWAVQALAETLERDARLRPWLTVRLQPHLAVDGRLLRQPRQPPVRLGPGEALVAARCDGSRCARAIAAELLADPGDSGLGTEADVFLLLENLRARGLVRWAFDVPLGPSSALHLRAALDGIADEAARTWALDALDALEPPRLAAAAAGDAQALDSALTGLERVFQELTGREPGRAAGEMYAARSLAYPECQRDARMRLGHDVTDALVPPLSLLLESARWATWRAATVYREALRSVHRDLAATAPGRDVELGDLWFWMQSLLFGRGERPIDAVVDGLRARWFDLLGLDGWDDPRTRVALRAADLRPAAAERFRAPAAGWPAARYCAPDVQVAAASAEALAAGHFLLVLGELHVAWNTLDMPIFVSQEPVPGQLGALVEQDLPAGRVVPMLPRDWPRNVTRTRSGLVTPADVRFAFAPADVDPGPNPVLPMAALTVREDDGELWVHRRDGGFRMELVEFAGALLSQVVVDVFRHMWLPDDRPAGHLPRVSVDRLVVLRESWSVPVAAVGFATGKDEAARFLGARRWARQLGLPRFVFVRVPGETKPFYLDLESPPYVETLAWAVRAAVRRGDGERSMLVTEMVPRPDEVWLPDPEGRGCCCELRLVLFDRGE
jgi:hypothetical protein